MHHLHARCRDTTLCIGGTQQDKSGGQPGGDAQGAILRILEQVLFHELGNKGVQDLGGRKHGKRNVFHGEFALRAAGLLRPHALHRHTGAIDAQGTAHGCQPPHDIAQRTDT